MRGSQRAAAGSSGAVSNPTRPRRIFLFGASAGAAQSGTRMQAGPQETPGQTQI
jgi:hypothetical protein